MCCVSSRFFFIRLWNIILCDRYCLFNEDHEDFSAWETISELVKFVDRIIVVGLQQERFNIVLTHFVLQFFEEVNIIFRKHVLIIDTDNKFVKLKVIPNWKINSILNVFMAVVACAVLNN
jgi:hypothetical protein